MGNCTEHKHGESIGVAIAMVRCVIMLSLGQAMPIHEARMWYYQVKRLNSLLARFN